MRRLIAAISIVLAASMTFGAGPVFADHTTRDRVLSENGLSYLLVGLVIVGAILVLALFAAAVLWWERRDAEPKPAQDSEP